MDGSGVITAGSTVSGTHGVQMRAETLLGVRIGSMALDLAPLGPTESLKGSR